MKLLLAIVQNEDVSEAMAALIKAGHRVTKLSSTGGLLGQGSTTLLCGLDEDHVDEAISLISSCCRIRTADLHRGHPLFPSLGAVRMGGAVGFVLDVEKFFRL